MLVDETETNEGPTFKLSIDLETDDVFVIFFGRRAEQGQRLHGGA